MYCFADLNDEELLRLWVEGVLDVALPNYPQMPSLSKF